MNTFRTNTFPRAGIFEPGVLVVGSVCFLLDSTSDRGEYIIGIGPDEPDGSDDNDKDYRQHDCILGDILSFLFAPQSTHKLHRYMPLS